MIGLQTKDRGGTGKMNRLKFLAIFVLGMALALAAIPFGPGRGPGIMNLGNLAWGKDLAASLKKSPLTQERRGKEDLKRS